MTCRLTSADSELFFATIAIFNHPERSCFVSGAVAAANQRKKSRRGNETKSFIRANLIKLFLVDYSCQIFNSAVAVHHRFQNSHPRWFVLENVVSLESRREEESVPLRVIGERRWNKLS